MSLVGVIPLYKPVNTIILRIVAITNFNTSEIDMMDWTGIFGTSVNNKPPSEWDNTLKR